MRNEIDFKFPMIEHRSYIVFGTRGERRKVEKSYLTRCVIFRSMDFERPISRRSISISLSLSISRPEVRVTYGAGLYITRN